MSTKHVWNYKTLLFTGALLVTSSLVVGSLATTVQASPLYATPEARKALEAGDYQAFKEAIRKENEQKRSNRAENLTEEQFKQIQENYKNKQSIEQAIANKDFVAFRKAVENLSNSVSNNNIPWGERGYLNLKKVDTQAEFEQLIQIRDKQKETETRLTNAAKNQNKEEFARVLREYRQYLDSYKGVDFVNINKRKAELTDAQIDNLYNRATELVKNGQEVDLTQGKLGKQQNQGDKLKKNQRFNLNLPFLGKKANTQN